MTIPPNFEIPKQTLALAFTFDVQLQISSFSPVVVSESSIALPFLQATPELCQWRAFRFPLQIRSCTR